MMHYLRSVVTPLTPAQNVHPPCALTTSYRISAIEPNVGRFPSVRPGPLFATPRWFELFVLKNDFSAVLYGSSCKLLG